MEIELEDGSRIVYVTFGGMYRREPEQLVAETRKTFECEGANVRGARAVNNVYGLYDGVCIWTGKPPVN